MQRTRPTSDQGPPAMALEEYTEKRFEILDEGKAREVKEVAVEFAKNGADAWRGIIGEISKGMKIGG